MPPAVGGSVRAGNHNGIAIQVAHPALPMVRATVAIRRVAMARQHNLNYHLGGALHYRVKIFHLEPEQHPIAIRSVVAITDGPMMMLDLKTVQLQDELTVLHQLLVLPATVISTAAQQALIPLAAGFDICDANERLGAHGPQPSRTPDFGKQISRNDRDPD
jgi:hypothetical protein